jgi:uncharacterized protein YbaP (TraB family)
MRPTSILLLLWCATATRAQQPAIANTTLWKISRGDTATPSYILLTGPVCDAAMRLSPPMKDVLARVRAVAMDYNLYDSRDAAAFQQYSVATTDSQRVSNNLSTGEFQAFADMMKGDGIPDQMVQQVYSYKVGMLYYLMLMLNSPCGLMSNQASYETLLRPYAKSKGLDYLVFQSAGDYLAEDSHHSNDYWRQNIRYVLNNGNEIKGKLQTEMTYYDHADLSGLKNLYAKDRFYQLKLGDAITRQHIIFLAEKIEQQVRRQPTFIAIQLYNVLGNAPSLFDILKSEGYSLTPVN